MTRLEQLSRTIAKRPSGVTDIGACVFTPEVIRSGGVVLSTRLRNTFGRPSRCDV